MPSAARYDYLQYPAVELDRVQRFGGPRSWRVSLESLEVQPDISVQGHRIICSTVRGTLDPDVACARHCKSDRNLRACATSADKLSRPHPPEPRGI